ncbi:GNAT family N-acetyltransferase [Miniimonas sp. S16]|uniref:GNAT family N-acetyltransferase n=1 Tax=Miniimonas sp. S16 TaxID=2171623 RepID=UPI00131F1CFF|nr:GNAT family N-acetyltransferase [Miniimonas sp. S16]
MARAGVVVGPADPTDLERLAVLLDDVQLDHPVGGSIGSTPRDVLLARLRAFLENYPSHASVATIEGEVVGLALGQTQRPGLFSQDPWLQIEVLYVRPGSRRRGAGRALLADQLAFAVAQGLSRIVTQPITGSRHEARFLSRLGFSPVGARRTADVGSLQRRLEGDPQRSGLESLIARRRVLREATPAHGIPAAPESASAGSRGGRDDRAADSSLGPAADLGDEARRILDDGPDDGPDGTPTAALAHAGPDSASTRQVRRAELMRRSASSTTSTR